MRNLATWLGLCGCLAIVGCSPKESAHAGAAPEEFRHSVETEVTATIHAFMAGFSAAKCDDVSTVSKYIRDGMIYVTASDVFTVL